MRRFEQEKAGSGEKPPGLHQGMHSDNRDVLRLNESSVNPFFLMFEDRLRKGLVYFDAR